MFRWIVSQKRVKQVIKNFNLMLKTDPYFSNRFYVKQLRKSYEEHVYYFIFRIYDNLTKTHRDTPWVADYSFNKEGKYFPREAFNIFNNFIISKLHNIDL